MPPIVCIGAKKKGDVYHARAVMALFPDVQAEVLRNPNELPDSADMMLAYLSVGGRAGRVRLVVGGVAGRDVPLRRAERDLERNNGGIPNAKRFSETGATSYISAKLRYHGERNANLHTLAGGMSCDADTDAILEDLHSAELGHFPAPCRTPLVLVNYRCSGQEVDGVHPALDSGETGMAQLLAASADAFLGATIVPVGEYVPPEWAGAKLYRYWDWPSVRGRGRAAEAEVLRCLLHSYNPRVVVGMRSGVLDLFAFLGFKAVSIDRRGENGIERVRNKTRVGLGPDLFQVVEMLDARVGELLNQRGTGQPHWAGDISVDDRARIIDAAAALY